MPGKRTSLYLTEKDLADLAASRKPLIEVVRLGLAALEAKELAAGYNARDEIIISSSSVIQTAVAQAAAADAALAKAGKPPLSGKPRPARRPEPERQPPYPHCKHCKPSAQACRWRAGHPTPCDLCRQEAPGT